MPVHRAKPGIWVCGLLRDYPLPAGETKCPLSFDQAAGRADGKVRIYYGRFTEDTRQALAAYYAACEPEANNQGGSALFRMVEGKFRLIRYFPGLVMDDCVVLPTEDAGRDTPYCLFSGLGQGTLDQRFGSLDLAAAAKPNADPIETWFESTNADGSLGVVVVCGAASPAIHEIMEVRAGAGPKEIVLEGDYVDPASAQAACARFRRGEFNDDERTSRENVEGGDKFAFLREGEPKYLRVRVHFDLPSREPRIEFTHEPAPAQ